MGREAGLMVVYGKKGCGKSFLTKKMMREYAAGNPAKGAPPRRVLVLDVNDEFTDIKAIAIKDVVLFSVHSVIEIRRIRPFLDNGTRMTLDDIANTLFFILNNYSNGMLLIEDINKYISDTMPNDLIGAICTNRHTGVDIVIHYQSIGRITSKVWQNLTLIRMHKITDTIAKHKHKFEDKFEFLSLGEYIINKKYSNGDRRFFLYADVDAENIYGAFSKHDFDLAVEEFMADNYNTLVSPLLKAVNMDGTKKHTAQSAIQQVKAHLSTFNGNLKRA